MKKCEFDLCINRGAIVKINKPKTTNCDVFEIILSLCVSPKEQYDAYEYDEQVKRLTSHISRSLKRYIMNNKFFYEKSIVDVTFTSANLRKGYYKNVQASAFVKLRNEFKYENLVKKIKNTIRPTIDSITDRFSSEGYVCHKRKKVINKNKQNTTINEYKV